MVYSADFITVLNLTAVSVEGLSPHMLDRPGSVCWFSPHLLIGPSHMGRNNLERDVKLNCKKRCLFIEIPAYKEEYSGASCSKLC